MPTHHFLPTNFWFALTVCVLLSVPAQADIVLYSNDFDGNVVAEPGVSVVISGGDQTSGDGITSGITNGQGYATSAGFGGDLWRVAAADDTLEFQLSNTPVAAVGNVEFSLAIIDSWDGGAGPDFIEVEILDGGTQQVLWQQAISGGTTPSSNVLSTLELNQDLGFRQGGAAETWWLDDGYRMSFPGIPMNGGSLTFRITPTGGGFQGGDDESFAIDNLIITSIPEPSAVMLGVAMGCLALTIRRRGNRC